MDLDELSLKVTWTRQHSSQDTVEEEWGRRSVELTSQGINIYSKP